jgi:hypothetical protein
MPIGHHVAWLPFLPIQPCNIRNGRTINQMDEPDIVTTDPSTRTAYESYSAVKIQNLSSGREISFGERPRRSGRASVNDLSDKAIWRRHAEINSGRVPESPRTIPGERVVASACGDAGEVALPFAIHASSKMHVSLARLT